MIIRFWKNKQTYTIRKSAEVGQNCNLPSIDRDSAGLILYLAVWANLIR